MNLPDLDSLSLFVMAAETRSLTKAADIACLSLAAASRRITLLEERFQTRLLDRTPRGVELTPAGAALLAHSKGLLLAVNRLQSEMSDHASGVKGSLRILATTSAMTRFLPQDLAAFIDVHPDVRLTIGEAWSEEIAQAVSDLKADMGIVVEGARTANLETRAYRSYHIAVVVPLEHPLLRGPVLSFTHVLSYDVIALESASLMMRTLFEQSILAQKTFSVRVQVRSFEAVCRLVQSGLGVGLLPYEAAIGLASDMNLAIRVLDESWATRAMVLCFRQEKERSKSLTSLIEHLARQGSPHRVP